MESTKKTAEGEEIPTAKLQKTWRLADYDQSGNVRKVINLMIAKFRCKNDFSILQTHEEKLGELRPVDLTLEDDPKSSKV